MTETNRNASDTKNLLIEVPIVILLLFVAFAFRLSLFSFINHDLTDALIPWYEYLLKNGGLRAINGLIESTHGFPPYIYSPPYLYLLASTNPLRQWFSVVEVIKLVSVGFDLISAIAVFLLVRLKFPVGWKKWAAFFAVCFAPTVFINSAYWGQFDGIYTALLAFCLYFICTRRYTLSLVFFATALAFKIQALLFAPLFLILLFQKKIAWWKFILVPLVFILWMVPAYMVGYPLLAPFETYLGGATQFQSISMNTPNIYTFLPNQFYGLIVPLGTLVGVVACAILILAAIRRETEFGFDRIVLFTLMISMVMPFVLPKMHERYFYPAALFAIVYYFYRPETRLLPLALQVTSLLSYVPFLIKDELVPLTVPAFINGLATISIVYLYFNGERQRNNAAILETENPGREVSTA